MAFRRAIKRPLLTYFIFAYAILRHFSTGRHQPTISRARSTKVLIIDSYPGVLTPENDVLMLSMIECGKLNNLLVHRYSFDEVDFRLACRPYLISLAWEFGFEERSTD